MTAANNEGTPISRHMLTESGLRDAQQGLGVRKGSKGKIFFTENGQIVAIRGKNDKQISKVKAELETRGETLRPLSSRLLKDFEVASKQQISSLKERKLLTDKSVLGRLFSSSSKIEGIFAQSFQTGVRKETELVALNRIGQHVRYSNNELTRIGSALVDGADHQQLRELLNQAQAERKRLQGCAQALNNHFQKSDAPDQRFRPTLDHAQHLLRYCDMVEGGIQAQLKLSPDQLQEQRERRINYQALNRVAQHVGNSGKELSRLGHSLSNKASPQELIGLLKQTEAQRRRLRVCVKAIEGHLSKSKYPDERFKPSLDHARRLGNYSATLEKSIVSKLESTPEGKALLQVYNSKHFHAGPAPTSSYREGLANGSYFVRASSTSAGNFVLEYKTARGEARMTRFTATNQGVFYSVDDQRPRLYNSLDGFIQAAVGSNSPIAAPPNRQTI